MSTHDHPGPLGGEPPRGGQPDAAARAGDHRHPALQADSALAHSSVAMKTFLTSVNACSASGPELAAEAGLLHAAERASSSAPTSAS